MTPIWPPPRPVDIPLNVGSIRKIAKRRNDIILCCETLLECVSNEMIQNYKRRIDNMVYNSFRGYDCNMKQNLVRSKNGELLKFKFYVIID